MTTLAELFPEAQGSEHAGRTVSGVTADSRKVRPGSVFVAVPGTKADGAAFIPQALAAGAMAIVGEAERPATLNAAVAYLRVADVREGDIFLTPQARVFAELGTQERKMMFAEHLLRHVPLAARIKKVLNERPGHRAPRVRFEQELEDFLSDKAAQETLDAVIDWGRYGEIFSYNDQTEMLSLEDVEA